MAYDFHGKWENTVGHNAPMHAPSSDSAYRKQLSVTNAANMWVKLSVTNAANMWVIYICYANEELFHAVPWRWHFDKKYR